MLIFVGFDKPLNFSRKIPEFHISYHVEIRMENYCSRCWLQSTIKIIHFRQYLWIMKKNIVQPYLKYKHIERLNELKNIWTKEWDAAKIECVVEWKKNKFIYRARRHLANRLQAEGTNWFSECKKKGKIRNAKPQNQLRSHFKKKFHPQILIIVANHMENVQFYCQ